MYPQHHICSGGYDKTVRLYDTRTGTLLKIFSGHSSSVAATIFNRHGNLIISGYCFHAVPLDT
jgi:WD40 repeat protein